MDSKKRAIPTIIIAIVATLAVASVAFFIVYNKFLKQEQPQTLQSIVVDTNAKEGDNTNPLADRTVSFVGLDDATLAEGGIISLENLPVNKDFFMKFVVIDNDTAKTVYETDLIPSGSHVDWVPSEDLDKGTYHLSFLQTPYYDQGGQNYIPLTSGNNEVTITLL